VTKIIGAYDMIITTERLENEASVIKDIRRNFRVTNYRILGCDSTLLHEYLPVMN
jgi:hypothetical protein